MQTPYTRLAYVVADVAGCIAQAMAPVYPAPNSRPAVVAHAVALHLRAAALRLHAADCLREARTWRRVAAALPAGDWLAGPARNIARSNAADGRLLRQRARAAAAAAA